MSATSAAPRTAMQGFLDLIERVGNKVPHPVVIFLYLIGGLIVLSVALALLGTSVTTERLNPATGAMEPTTTAVRGLPAADGIRFLYVSLIPNFMGFVAVGLLIG